MPSYVWFCRATSSGNLGLVREALDVAWSLPQRDAATPADIGEWRQRVEEAVPSEDDGGELPGSAVAQNAMACVAYALRAWETDDPREAAWAARQLYEAGDAVAQGASPPHTYVDDHHAPAVQLALRAIESIFREVMNADPPALFDSAKVDGEELLDLLKG